MVHWEHAVGQQEDWEIQLGHANLQLALWKKHADIERQAVEQEVMEEKQQKEEQVEEEGRKRSKTR